MNSSFLRWHWKRWNAAEWERSAWTWTGVRVRERLCLNLAILIAPVHSCNSCKFKRDADNSWRGFAIKIESDHKWTRIMRFHCFQMFQIFYPFFASFATSKLSLLIVLLLIWFFFCALSRSCCVSLISWLKR